jgi:four helix bundle protein
MRRLTEDIRERTMEFASAIARLRMTLPDTRREVSLLGEQLLRAGTSIAAHVREASQSSSEVEICSRLEGAIERTDESMLCLEMLQNDCAIGDGSLAHLRREADEIMTAFESIVSRLGGRSL